LPDQQPLGRAQRSVAVVAIRALIGVLMLACLVSACDGGGGKSAAHSSSVPTSTGSAVPPATIVLRRVRPAKANCAPNIANDAITGASGTASAIGWAGNEHGVVTCLGGRFFVQGDINKAFGFEIYDASPTTWVDAQGYLPAQVTSFRRNGAAVVITEFADRIVIDGHQFVAVYSRVAVTNPTNAVVVANPFPSSGLLSLSTAPARVLPQATGVHDYVLAVDRFGHSYSWPSPRSLVAAGSFDQHFAHMRAFWDSQLRKIAQVTVPDGELNDAYRSGFISTMIARSGIHSNTGVNNYESEFSHDVVGILANLFTQGDYDQAHALLLDARDVVGAPEYIDGLWTYAWPWAVYLLKTGDLSFVKANFSTSGPAGPSQPSIEQSAHQIASDRTGPNGIIRMTDDIDTNGYWTVDDYEALMGLAAYRYLAHAVGDASETTWATHEYNSLLAATNATLSATMKRYHFDYLPCSIVQPNTANRCKNPEDANWAAPFLFGRWPWDAQIFGASVPRSNVALVDATYAYGFHRLAGRLPANTFGGYPSSFYSSGYNAGYGSGALAGMRHRDQGILSYQFMIARTQSGPYSWWESASAPANSPWVGSHPKTGGGASPHAWGIANSNKVLLDSLATQAADGSLIVGRGVPDDWVNPGKTIAVTNFPTTNGKRIALTISAQDHSVTLTLNGSSGTVLFQLPEFVNNIASSSAGTVEQATGTVRISARDHSVTVQLRTAS
jgi:hypothetical protein